MKHALGLLFALLLPSCSLTALDDEGSLEPTKNTCDSSSDCPGGACDAKLGICVSPQSEFPNVVLEITPPASVPEYGGITFLKEVDSIPVTGGQLEAKIDFVAKVVGTVDATNAGYQSDCVPMYGPDQDRAGAPVKLRFTPTARILGLGSAEYVVATEFNEATGKYEFEAWMPADTYDIYIEPNVGADYPIDPGTVTTPSCQIAPQFAYSGDGGSWEIPAGDLSLPIVLQPPSLLTVVVPSPVNLDGWIVEMVHPTTGRLLSAPVQLALDSDHQYVAEVEYTKLQDADNVGRELVRIRPAVCGDDATCTPVVGPTLVVERQAVELFTEGKALIDQLSKLDVGESPDPEFPRVMLKDVNLLLKDQDFYSGSASVRFVSKDEKLDLRDQNGPLEGVQAFFDQTVTTEEGRFDVTLLPGEYDVYVAPAIGSGYATTHETMLVAFQGDPNTNSDVQNGKSIQLQEITEVQGSVVTPSMEGAAGAQVEAVATPIPPTKLKIAAGATPLKPQALSGIVNEAGGFTLQGDPGILDFSVRPPEGTAFPWLVRPNVDVQSIVHELGEMEIGWPIVYDGAVELPGQQLVGGALIRVYVYLDANGYAQSRESATTVLQIAETRADANGSFRLFLPPHLN